MSWLWATKKRRKLPAKYKKPTVEEHADRELIRQMRKDPDCALRIAKQRHGIKDEFEDPIEKAKRKVLAELYENDEEFRELLKQEEIQAHTPRENLGSELALATHIDQAALETIEQNPSILKRAAERRIASIVGSNQSASGALSEVMETWRTMKDLEEEFGGGKEKGSFQSLLTPEVLTSALQIIASRMGVQVPASEVYVVETEDGLLKLTPAEYEQYRRQLAPPSPNGEPPPTETPPTKGRLRISEWEEYLEGEPDAFVADLIAAYGKEDPDAIFTLNIIRSKTPGEIIAMLRPFRDRTDVGKVIQRLEEQKDWLEEVMRLTQAHFEESP